MRSMHQEVLFLAAIPRDGVAPQRKAISLLRCTVARKLVCALGPWVQPQESFALAEMPQLEAVQGCAADWGGARLGRCNHGVALLWRRGLFGGRHIAAAALYRAAVDKVERARVRVRCTAVWPRAAVQLLARSPLWSGRRRRGRLRHRAIGRRATASQAERRPAGERRELAAAQRTGDVGGGPLQLSYYGQYSAYTDCVYRVASEWVFWADPDSFVATQQPCRDSAATPRPARIYAIDASLWRQLPERGWNRNALSGAPTVEQRLQRWHDGQPQHKVRGRRSSRSRGTAILLCSGSQDPPAGRAGEAGPDRCHALSRQEQRESQRLHVAVWQS